MYKTKIMAICEKFLCNLFRFSTKIVIFKRELQSLFVGASNARPYTLLSKVSERGRRSFDKLRMTVFYFGAERPIHITNKN